MTDILPEALQPVHNTTIQANSEPKFMQDRQALRNLCLRLKIYCLFNLV